MLSGATLLAAGALTSAHAGNHSHGASSSQEPALQSLLDREFGPGVLSAGNDYAADGTDALWRAGSGASATLLFEYAGFASASVFGIYDSTSPDARLPLFYGFAESGAGSTLSITQLAGGGFRFSATSGGITESAIFGSSVFGFYLRTPENVFYGNTGLNGDETDHLKAFGVEGLTSAQGRTYGSDSYLLAWEDLLNGGDRDFNDLVIGVQGFTTASTPAPVPLPGGLLLLGSGILGLAGMSAGRRSRRTGAG